MSQTLFDLLLQSLASAVLAPSLTLVADSLSLEWRKQLTKRVHQKYLKGTAFYSVSHLSGMQVGFRTCKDYLTYFGTQKPSDLH